MIRRETFSAHVKHLSFTIGCDQCYNTCYNGCNCAKWLSFKTWTKTQTTKRLNKICTNKKQEHFASDLRVLHKYLVMSLALAEMTHQVIEATKARTRVKALPHVQQVGKMGKRGQKDEHVPELMTVEQHVKPARCQSLRYLQRIEQATNRIQQVHVTDTGHFLNEQPVLESINPKQVHNRQDAHRCSTTERSQPKLTIVITTVLWCEHHDGAAGA